MFWLSSMFSLDTGDLRPGTVDKGTPASSASPRSSIASDASSVVSLISSAIGELRRSSVASDPGTKGEVDADNPYQQRPSYTIGGTRSRENSVSSATSDDILDDLPSATKSDVGSPSEVTKSANNKDVLKSSLKDIRSNCRDVATKLQQISSELKDAIGNSISNTSTMLKDHTDKMSDYYSVAIAAIKAAKNQGANHQVIKEKLAELEAMARKVQGLRQIAETIERDVESLQQMNDLNGNVEALDGNRGS